MNNAMMDKKKRPYLVPGNIRIPHPEEVEGNFDDAIVHLHWQAIDSAGGFDWFVTGYDKNNNGAYCLQVLHQRPNKIIQIAWNNVSVTALENIPALFSKPTQLDRNWVPKPIGDVIEQMRSLRKNNSIPPYV